MNQLFQDLKYAVRMLARTPAFTTVAVLSLAIGIGANAAIFTVVNAVMLKSLPVRDPQQLVQVNMGPNEIFSTALWESLAERQQVFSGVFAVGRTRYELAGGGESHAINGQLVSGNFFATLGVTAALGRLLTPADDRPGCPAAAVLSYDLWQRNYGADYGVLGKTILLSNQPYQIIGVSRAGFFGVEVGSHYDVAAPLCSLTIADPRNNALTSRRTFWLRVIGRPKPGLGLRQVSAQLKAVAAQVFEASLPQNYSAEQRRTFLARTLDVSSAGRGLSYLRTEYSRGLYLLMALSGSVLLIACINIANLLLARSAARAREIAVRLAVGASRPRLIRQLLTESLLLSALGASVGVLLALWASPLLVRLISQSNFAIYLDLSLDSRAVAFTTAVAILTGLLFGLAPAWRGSSVSPNAALKEGGRTATGSRSRFGLGKTLVVSQVALSLVLLIAAGLLVRTFRNLMTLDAGFRRDNVLIATVNLQNLHLPAAARASLHNAVVERLRAIPGVLHVAGSNAVPISGGSITNEVSVEGFTPRSHLDATVHFNEVSPDYFATMGTPLLAGRDFTSNDRTGAPPAVIVNETMARKFFPGRSPLGQTFRFNGASEDAALRVIGLVRDAKYSSLREEAPPTVYVAMAQGPGATYESQNLEIAGTGAAASLMPAVREAIANVNPAILIESVAFTTQIADSLLQERLLATLSGFFGGVAVLLAIIGLYGVMSYGVARRRAEIGIRMALGAQQAMVLRLVLREAALLIVVGLVIGLSIALASTRLLTRMLFGLTPTDPRTIGLAMLLLAMVAAAAAYVPARRASRIDPMTTLREE